MKNKSALLLFAHGARDARWAQPIERLRSTVAQARPGMRVEIAYLELQAPGLPETLAMLTAAGVTRVDIAPIFWSKGGHIARDLPALVEAFTAQHPAVVIRILPVLAELPGMDDFVARAILAQVGAP